MLYSVHYMRFGPHWLDMPRTAFLLPSAQELLTKAQSGESAAELARIEGLLSAEEASLFRQARDAQEAFDRWRFGGRAPARAGSLKRRLEGIPANGAQ